MGALELLFFHSF